MSRLVIAFIDDAQAKTVEKILRDVIDGIPMIGPVDDLDALADAVRDGATVDHDAAAQVYSADVLARMVAPDLTASVEALAARADASEVECARLRRMLDHAPPWRVSDPPTDEEMHALRLRWATGPERYQADADALIAAVMHGRSERAKITARAEAAEQERDAALAAVDAVRADYAPRREPPTADEVRAVSRLWGASNAPVLLQIPRGFVTANVSTGVRGSIVGWTEPDVRRVAAAESWLFLGPNGPVAWSELAALVRGGDRG